MLRRFTSALVSLLVLLGTVGPVAAFEGSEGVFARVYLTVPFGGEKTARSVPSFGFSVGPTLAFPEDPSSPAESDNTVSFADIRFTPEGLSALSFGGIDALEKDLRLHANGEEETVRRINWGYVLVGLAGAGLVVGAVIVGSDGDDCGYLDFNCAWKKALKKACKKEGGTWEKGQCVAS